MTLGGYGAAIRLSLRDHEKPRENGLVVIILKYFSAKFPCFLCFKLVPIVGFMFPRVLNDIKPANNIVCVLGVQH